MDVLAVRSSRPLRRCRMWDRESDSREHSVEVKEPLPSDSRFRDDLNALAAGDMEKAQARRHLLAETDARTHARATSIRTQIHESARKCISAEFVSCSGPIMTSLARQVGMKLSCFCSSKRIGWRRFRGARRSSARRAREDSRKAIVQCTKSNRELCELLGIRCAS